MFRLEILHLDSSFSLPDYVDNIEFDDFPCQIQPVNYQDQKPPNVDTKVHHTFLNVAHRRSKVWQRDGDHWQQQLFRRVQQKDRQDRRVLKVKWNRDRKFWISYLGVTRDSHLSVANNLFGITLGFELDGLIHFRINDIHFVQKNIKPRRLFIASNEDISTSFPPLPQVLNSKYWEKKINSDLKRWVV